MVSLDPSALPPKSKSVEYVGLKNLGATCYINSLVQQLFMIKPFREALLNASLEGVACSSVLYQTMLLFVSLLHS